MRIEQLAQIIEIDFYRSVSKAADGLGMQQSSLSASVSALEKELGYKIFRRTPTGVIPTMRGAEALDIARRVLKDARELSASFEHQSVLSGIVHMGVSPTVSNSITADLLRYFYEHNPGTRLYVKEQNALEVLQAVKNQSCRLGATGFLDKQMEAIAQISKLWGIHLEILWANEPLYLYVGRESVFFERERVSVADIAQETMINHGILNYFKLMELPEVRPSITVYDSEVLQKLVSDNVGAAIFASSFVCNNQYIRQGLIRGIPFEDFPFRGTCALLYKDNYPLSSLERAVLSKVRELLLTIREEAGLDEN